MRSKFERYYNAVDYLESMFDLPHADYYIRKSGRSLFIKRLGYFLELLGGPEKKMKYIHVGGTSGKGSTATMIQAILTEAGFKTGIYTSPHPTTTLERIKINETLIGPDEFADLVDEIKPAIDKAYLSGPYGRPSYFEILTALALLYFKRQNCDYVVLEVGLGGRYDATNVIPAPAVAIINKVSYDHTEVLGNTLTEIATEKSGIIKKDTMAVITTGDNHKKVIEIFKKRCELKNVPLRIVKTTEDKVYELPLLGLHQQKNAKMAAEVARVLGLSETAIKNGLKKTRLICRLEAIQENPTVILDGAHNPAKMKTTAAIIKRLKYNKLLLVTALTKDKNVSETYIDLKPLVDKIFITRYKSNLKKCYSPLELRKKLKFNGPTEIYLDNRMALDQALKQAKKNDLVLVTGSFYLAGQLRKIWWPETHILKERKINSIKQFNLDKDD